jgi:hypothetical protein
MSEIKRFVYLLLIEFLRTKRVKQTDLRIKLMNEIIKSIHLVKMYVWERPFQSKVERVRRYVQYSSMIRKIFWMNLDKKHTMLFVNR